MKYMPIATLTIVLGVLAGLLLTELSHARTCYTQCNPDNTFCTTQCN